MPFLAHVCHTCAVRAACKSLHLSHAARSVHECRARRLGSKDDLICIVGWELDRAGLIVETATLFQLLRRCDRCVVAVRDCIGWAAQYLDVAV